MQRRDTRCEWQRLQAFRRITEGCTINGAMVPQPIRFSPHTSQCDWNASGSLVTVSITIVLKTMGIILWRRQVTTERKRET